MPDEFIKDRMSIKEFHFFLSFFFSYFSFFSFFFLPPVEASGFFYVVLVERNGPFIRLILRDFFREM